MEKKTVAVRAVGSFLRDKGDVPFREGYLAVIECLSEAVPES
jgi:hypothetical protein